jgi:hypothetical protein
MMKKATRVKPYAHDAQRSIVVVRVSEKEYDRAILNRRITLTGKQTGYTPERMVAVLRIQAFGKPDFIATVRELEKTNDLTSDFGATFYF